MTTQITPPAEGAATTSGGSSKLLFAHYLRGAGAMSVLLAHFGFAFFNAQGYWASLIGGPLIKDPMPFPKLVEKLSFFPAISGFLAVFGVSIFFLISGFVIPFSLAKSSFKDFWILRLVRLLPTYAAVLLLNMAVAFVCCHIYNQAFPHTLPVIVTQLMMGFQYLFKNLPVTDPVCWTLGIELVFYIFASIVFKTFGFGLRPAIILNAAVSILLLLAIKLHEPLLTPFAAALRSPL